MNFFQKIKKSGGLGPSKDNLKKLVQQHTKQIIGILTLSFVKELTLQHKQKKLLEFLAKA